jgi:hypothetical protein
MTNQVERTVHFSAAEEVGELSFGSATRWFVQWQITAKVEPPMNWDELSDLLRYTVPEGSEDPLRAYMRHVHDETGTDLEADLADGFTITHQREDSYRDEEMDVTMRRHLQDEIAPAIATALGATLIQD